MNNINQFQSNEIITASILHDIGKLHIPKEILNKKTSLTRKEFDEIKKHSYYGYEIAKSYNLNDSIANAILRHHERLNGTGYPNNITNLCEYSKIISVSDVFEAITSKRSYKNEKSFDYAIAVMEKTSQLSFDYKYLNSLKRLTKSNVLNFKNKIIVNKERRN